jgi:hypothetical protein
MKLIASENFELLKRHGVPVQVLLAQHPENIERHVSHIEIPNESGSTLLDKKKQLNAIASFEKTIASKKDRQAAPFLLIASRSYNFVAQQFALLIVANLIETCGPNFWWHPIYGGLSDYLRDTDNPPELKGIRLLVLSNVDENSIDYKIEKTRDILDKYSHIPRILCVGGVDPVTFSKKKLHVLPNFYVYC